MQNPATTAVISLWLALVVSIVMPARRDLLIAFTMACVFHAISAGIRFRAALFPAGMDAHALKPVSLYCHSVS